MNLKKINLIIFYLALAYLVIDADESTLRVTNQNAMNLNEEKNMIFQYKIEKLFHSKIKPVSMRLYQKLISNAALFLGTNRNEIITYYKGRNRPQMIKNQNGKFNFIEK